MRNKLYVLFLLLFLFLPATALAQDMVLEDYFTSGQYLNAQIAADTSSAAFKAGTRVYVLHRDGIYAWNSAMAMPAGSTIKFRAAYGETGNYPPFIYFYPTATGGGAPPGQFMTINGNSTFSISNVVVACYNEQVDTLLRYANTMFLRTQSAGNNRIYIDSCIIKNIAGQIIRTETATSVISVTNSIFADMGHPTSNFGAGKFIDLRNVATDSVFIQNCTFINLYDRVIRHYNASAANCIKNFIFDHNTVLYDMSYHGFLSLGTVDSTGLGVLQITNNLFVDHFALGADTAAVRQAEFGDPGENDPENDLPRMAWVLTNRNNAANWDIQKNYYASTDSGKAMFALGADPDFAGPYYQNAGPALTWNMNRVLALQSKDTVNNFVEVTNLSLVKAPGLMTELIRWVLNKSLDNKLKPTLINAANWNWTYDFHRHKAEYYYDTLDCSYYSSTDLSHAGTDGKIIGDTRWTWKGIVHGAFVATPTSMNFDTVVVSASKEDSVIVTNLGGSALILDTVKSTSAEFTVTPASASIAAGGSQKFTVTFSPASVGSKSASIVFIQNAAAQRDTVAVRGAGKTSVGVTDAELNLPKVYQLHNNYPNPFNPSTVISYDLPHQSQVVLKVYSLLGQEVATLVDGVQEAGYYHTTWGAQQAGKSLASGVYLFRISAQSTAKAGQTFVQVKKMLLIK